MAYEAMLAGLEMTPFWGGMRMKDLEPNTVKDSMGCHYKPLEYLSPLIKWEVHSEDHPPLLTGDDPPPRHFSRSVFLFFHIYRSLNKDTKDLASQTSQADIRTPKTAFICMPAQGEVSSESFRKPSRFMDQ